MTSLFVLMTFAVNHAIRAIEEWNIAYDYYSQHDKCHDGSTVDMIMESIALFSLAVNVDEQQMKAFLTEKCCCFNLQTKAHAHLRWCCKFYYICMQNFSAIKTIQKL